MRKYINNKLMLLALVVFIVCCVSNGSANAQNVPDKVDIHGFVSQGFLYTTDNNFLADSTDNGSFEFNELGINFGTQLNKDLRIGMQLFSRDLGDVDNNKVVVDWAFGDYRLRDWLGVRAGIIKQPGLLLNEIRDVDALRTSVILPQGVYPDETRESFVAVQGVGIYGSIPLSAAGDLSYQLIDGSVNVPPDGGSAQTALSTGELSDVNYFDFNEVYVGYLEWMTPVDGLRIAGAYRFTKADIQFIASPKLGPLAGKAIDAEFPSLDAYSVSVEYVVGDLVLLAETRRIDATTTYNIPGGITTQMSNHIFGWYASASYRVDELLEVGTYYSEYYPNKDDMNGDGLEAQGLDDFGAWTRDLALSTRFDLTSNLTFKLEGHYINGAGGLNIALNPDGSKEDFFVFASKVSYMF